MWYILCEFLYLIQYVVKIAEIANIVIVRWYQNEQEKIISDFDLFLCIIF